MGGQSVSQVVILSTGERFTQQNCPAGLSAAAAAAAAWYFREAWPAWYWSCPRLRPALHATAQGRQPGEISRHSSRQKDLPGKKIFQAKRSSRTSSRQLHWHLIFAFFDAQHSNLLHSLFLAKRLKCLPYIGIVLFQQKHQEFSSPSSSM